MNGLISRITQDALDAARGHQEEFPGEPLSGDWDVEAWTECRHGRQLTDEASEALWPVFQTTLKTAINLARKGT
jgi:hypothetical protein